MGHPEGVFEVCLQRDWGWGFVEHQRLLQMQQAPQTDQANFQTEASQKFHLQSFSDLGYAADISSAIINQSQ